jgi:putative ABC transport system ATP-binding protein
VLSIGLDFDVGSGGKRLTNVQRQKLNLARALLKRADYLIFNRPLVALDHRIQDQIVRTSSPICTREIIRPRLSGCFRM